MAPKAGSRGSPESGKAEFEGRDLLVGRPEVAVEDRPAAEAPDVPPAMPTPQPEEPSHVCREVVVELVWVLERAYGYSRDRIATILEEVVATEGLVVEAADDVARAAFRYLSATAGFADVIVLAAAGRAAALPLYTFDGKSARLEAVELLR